MDKISIYKEIVGFAGEYSEMSILIIGGTIATILGTSYVSPRNKNFRYTYFLFIPGWILGGLVVNTASMMNRSYIAFLFNTNNGNFNAETKTAVLKQIEAQINRDFSQLLDYFHAEIIIFGLWLLVYISWWIVNKKNI